MTWSLYPAETGARVTERAIYSNGKLEAAGMDARTFVNSPYMLTVPAPDGEIYAMIGRHAYIARLDPDGWWWVSLAAHLTDPVEQARSRQRRRGSW